MHFPVLNFSASLAFACFLRNNWDDKPEKQMLYRTQLDKGMSKTTQNELLDYNLEDCVMSTLNCLLQGYSEKITR